MRVDSISTSLLQLTNQSITWGPVRLTALQATIESISDTSLAIGLSFLVQDWTFDKSTGGLELKQYCALYVLLWYELALANLMASKIDVLQPQKFVIDIMLAHYPQRFNLWAYEACKLSPKSTSPRGGATIRPLNPQWPLRLGFRLRMLLLPF